jgi:hypothetical protein
VSAAAVPTGIKVNPMDVTRTPRLSPNALMMLSICGTRCCGQPVGL